MSSITLPTSALGRTPSHLRSHSHSHSRSTSLSSLKSITPTAVHSLIVPILILLLIVVASAAQTEIAHHLTSDIGYHQPYFTFFLTHITFALVFPLHLGLLLLVRPKPLHFYLDGLRWIIADQVGHSSDSWRVIAPVWSKKVTWLTVLISVPALCWFVAVNLTTGLSVTTIYASSSFWTYLFSMVLLKQPLSRVTVGSIALAFAGVVVLSLDGMSKEGSVGAPNPMLGDIVMMFGALVLGLYEVVYKMALPEGHGGVKAESREMEGYASLPTTVVSDPLDSQTTRLGAVITPPDSRSVTPPPRRNVPSDGVFPPIDRQSSRTPLLVSKPLSPPSSESESPEPTSPISPSRPSRIRSLSHSTEPECEAPVLPTALHANFLTSCIGFATFVLLWIPIPLLHWIGWEAFRWPGQQGGNVWEIWAGLEVVAWGGAVYNAGLMVLIGVWGPTTSSVANLLTIGLVAVIDAVWVGEVPSLQSLVGVGMICIGFGILLWEGEE